MKSRVRDIAYHPVAGWRVTPATWIFAPEWLTFQEAHELTGRPPETIQKWVDRGFLPSREEEIEGEHCIAVNRDRLHALLDLIVDDIAWQVQRLDREKNQEDNDV